MDKHNEESMNAFWQLYSCIMERKETECSLPTSCVCIAGYFYCASGNCQFRAPLLFAFVFVHFSNGPTSSVYARGTLETGPRSVGTRQCYVWKTSKDLNRESSKYVCIPRTEVAEEPRYREPDHLSSWKWHKWSKTSSLYQRRNSSNSNSIK